MPFKNANESAFVGGKKHWTDVIKNSGPGELLIWRQPEEDFNTNSTLIVNPGEEAIFIKDGNVEQVFSSGKYELSTNNYPFISRLRMMFSGGISTFNCVVYFVRTATSREIFWGTTSPIKVRDKVLGVETGLVARGSYRIRVDDGAKFLWKLVGNNVPFEMQSEIDSFFVSEFQSKIRSVLSREIQKINDELLGIDARLDELSEMVEPFIQEIITDYGLKCEKFVVEAIDFANDDLRRQYEEARMGINIQVMNAQGQKAALGVLGDDFGRLKAAEILTNISTNPGSGGLASAGAGLGLGAASVGVFGDMARQIFAPVTSAAQNTQQNAAGMQTMSAANRFSQKNTETPAAPAQASAEKSPVEILSELKQLLDLGLIEKEEFDAKKLEILSRM